MPPERARVREIKVAEDFQGWENGAGIGPIKVAADIPGEIVVAAADQKS